MNTVKAIQFERDLFIDGTHRVKAGDVRPLSELPLDHVACALRLGYATQIDVPDDKPADKPKPPAKPAK